jgi:hypothetical protein
MRMVLKKRGVELRKNLINHIESIKEETLISKKNDNLIKDEIGKLIFEDYGLYQKQLQESFKKLDE